MPIARLSPLLVNQIAAGEVIERPASVVKELVENSLDAGASAIEVHVEDGGRQLIRVRDNGSGIDESELRLAIEPHATSKIVSTDDLAAIETMGFRGEALASIASVSRLAISTRTANAEAGARIEAHGDQVGPIKPDACAVGTVIEVRDLFFNTPARRKFMRGAPTEFGHINELLSRLAIAHPDVAIQLCHGQRTALNAPAQTQRARCLHVLGRELDEALLEFESEERGIGLWGLAGQPSIARATTRHQYVYVNGRPIRDKRVSHAIKEAYRGLIDPSRQPVLVLFISVEPTMVDVNVHPAKAEVRFADANAVHGQVLATIRQRLLGSDLTPRLSFGGGEGSGDESSGRSLMLEAMAAANQQMTGRPFAPPSPAPAPPSGPTQRASASTTPGSEEQRTRDFVDYFRSMDPRQKGFVYQQVRAEMEAEASGDNGASSEDGESLTSLPTPTRRPILQVHDSYVVTQDETGLVIVDQHALHERMMFEQLLQRIRTSGRLESQRLLTPVTFHATAAQMSVLETLQPLLEQVGVEAGPMGPETIAIHAFATLLFDRNVEPDDFLRELLDRAEEDALNPSDEAALHEVLDMMSCKAAIKAGESLSEQELSELLARREQLERASNCPHGRPTTVRLSLRDLEKQFKRT